MKVTPTVVKAAEGQGGALDLKGLTVPFTVKGPWAKLSFAPALGDVFQNKAKSALDKTLEKNNLGGIFGGKSSDGKATNPLSNLFGKKAPATRRGTRRAKITRKHFAGLPRSCSITKAGEHYWQASHRHAGRAYNPFGGAPEFEKWRARRTLMSAQYGAVLRMVGDDERQAPCRRARPSGSAAIATSAILVRWRAPMARSRSPFAIWIRPSSAIPRMISSVSLVDGDGGARL